MPANKYPDRVESALSEAEAYDAQGLFAARLDELERLRKRALRQGKIVNRAALSAVMTGDRAATLALAKAYAAALHGFELTSGRPDQEDIVTVQTEWTDLVGTRDGRALDFRHAQDRVYEAKCAAEGGVLIIGNIYDLPACEPDPKAVDQGRNGGFQMIYELLTQLADKNHTPVIVLTGAEDKMAAFFSENAYLADLFNTKSIIAGPGPAPAASVALSASLTVRPPLALRKKAP